MSLYGLVFALLPVVIIPITPSDSGPTLKPARTSTSHALMSAFSIEPTVP